MILWRVSARFFVQNTFGDARALRKMAVSRLRLHNIKIEATLINESLESHGIKIDQKSRPRPQPDTEQCLHLKPIPRNRLRSLFSLPTRLSKEHILTIA
jgi:hypothetical protein